MVENPPANAGGVGSIPGWGTMIPYALRHSQKIKKTKNNLEKNKVGGLILLDFKTYYKANRKSKQYGTGEFPGSPVVRTPRFHCRRHGFDPWSGN